jgi:hypothetical protein
VTLEALGNLAQIAGVIAVVLAIAYLTAQIRENTRALRLAAHQAATEAHSQYLGAVARDENLARILRSAQSDTSNLTDDERFRLDMLLFQVFNHFEGDFYHRREGVLPAPLAERFDRILASWLTQPGVREWWNQRKSLLSSDFVTWVDAELLRVKQQPGSAGDPRAPSD